MEKTVNRQRFYLDVPIEDVCKMRTIARTIGWNVRKRKNGLDEALDVS